MSTPYVEQARIKTPLTSHRKYGTRISQMTSETMLETSDTLQKGVSLTLRERCDPSVFTQTNRASLSQTIWPGTRTSQPVRKFCLCPGTNARHPPSQQERRQETQPSAPRNLLIRIKIVIQVFTRPPLRVYGNGAQSPAWQQVTKRMQTSLLQIFWNS